MFVQSEVKQLTAENEELKATMKMEKERLHSLEAAMEELHRRGRSCVTCCQAWHRLSGPVGKGFWFECRKLWFKLRPSHTTDCVSVVTLSDIRH